MHQVGLTIEIYYDARPCARQNCVTCLLIRRRSGYGVNDDAFGRGVNSRVLVLVYKHSEDSIDPRFFRRKLVGKALLLETVNKYIFRSFKEVTASFFFL